MNFVHLRTPTSYTLAAIFGLFLFLLKIPFRVWGYKSSNAAKYWRHQISSDEIPNVHLISQQRRSQLQPVVAPHVLHFKHVPLRTSVKFPHSPHESPT